MSVSQKRPDFVALLGLGWAANSLAKGFVVRAFDPTAGSIDHAAKFLGATWPSLRALGLTDASE